MILRTNFVIVAFRIRKIYIKCTNTFLYIKILNERRGELMKVISVCVGSSCHLKGSYDIIKIFKKLIKDNNLDEEWELKAEFCCNNCRNPVSVRIGDSEPYSIEVDNAKAFFKEKILGA
jgi:NADH:ubiquinone oxidoreductase subunit E